MEVVIGIANHVFDYININDRHINNISSTLGFLLHEYSHLFIKYSNKYNCTPTSFSIEEGTCDLFADLVMNHYIEKHNQIQLGERKIRIEYPYSTYSLYDFENAWQRTILAGLEGKGKNPIEALSEYMLGDKYKYIEMYLGKEKARTKKLDQFGVPNCETNYDEIYSSDEMDFSEIDENSIYARRNYILPIFEIQNYLNETNDYILNGNSYNVIDIAPKYFKGRKLYEISREEMAKFYKLYLSQIIPQKGKASTVCNFYEYFDNEIQSIKQEEIFNKSFQLLDAFLGIINKDTKLGRTSEEILQSLVDREIELIQEEQPLRESLRKYARLIPDYLAQINNETSFENIFFIDRIKDLQFYYLEQLREKLEDGKNEEIISALTDNTTGEIFSDSAIRKLLLEYDIRLEPKDGYDDVLNGGVRRDLVIAATNDLKKEIKQKENKEVVNIERKI